MINVSKNLDREIITEQPFYRYDLKNSDKLNFPKDTNKEQKLSLQLMSSGF